MENTGIEQKEQPRNEIDLLELFRLMGRGIRNFFKWVIDAILFLFVFGIRRIHWLVLIVIAGAGIGYLIYLTTERYYSSEMIIQPNGFTSIDMAYYINDIHDFCVNKNIEAIQIAFQITEESSINIKDINAFYFIDVNDDGIGDYVDYKSKYNPEDTNRVIVFNRLLIRSEVFKNDAFAEVKNGLLNYINNNPYLVKVNELRKQELRELIEQADDEIMKLDSLQNFEYYTSPADRRTAARDGQLVFMNEKETQLYYQDKVALLSRKMQYQKSLELATTPITIIKDFSALDIEDNPPGNYIINGCFYTGLAGYLLFIFLVYRKKIIGYLSSYN